ncbi:MAG TPA: adenylyltransferase/cytidyltransferase family protein, partial [Magnetospirillaceae bacterium]|nr:adenylyltransferase/cytidyltransferase family protein [Magnetospirillaceae bacterium]
MKRVGVFSGTFDPVHRGHLAFALSAQKRAQLDTVVFLPEHSPRGKIAVGSFTHRLEMLRLATKH